jgi:hypothetical protein
VPRVAPGRCPGHRARPHGPGGTQPRAEPREGRFVVCARRDSRWRQGRSAAGLVTLSYRRAARAVRRLVPRLVPQKLIIYEHSIQSCVTSCSFGAAYRNRTDDLRITRRIPTVHHRPVGHSRPAREAPRSAHVQSHAELLLADPLARPGHHSVAFATFTTPRPSTSSGSNAPPRLTCLDCSKRPLTWGTVSRQFSLILVPS